MTNVEIGLLGIAALMILIFLGVHVGLTLILVGFFGFALIGGWNASLMNLGIVPFEKVNSFDFAVVPLFMLMSNFVSFGGIATGAYEAARTWVGHLRGGLALATAGACGLFAAVSGSSLAGAVTFGKVAYPEMKRLGYDVRLATGVICAGGTIGILIPPSMGFVIIGVLTQLSIGQLFMAGVFPGILQVICYMVTIIVWCRINPKLAPAGIKTTTKEKISAFKTTWPIGLLFIIVMGGIYGGVFTATEAGGIGAFGALVIALVRRELTRTTFFESLKDTAVMSSTLIVMLVGAFVFNAFLAITRIPFEASQFIVSLGIPSYAILVVVLIFYIILGCFFDVWAVLVLTIPVIYPAMDAMGFDLIWYSVLMVRIVEIGLVTPPFGLNLFALASVVDSPVGSIYKGVIPFVISDFIHVGILVALPALSTFLPEMMIR